MTEPNDVLDFWFKENGPSAWFAKDDAFDAAIVERFGEAHGQAMDGALDSWADDPYGGLALILVLDQFSRNMFRDTAQAFASDPKALGIAKAMVASGADKKLGAHERPFIYLPYEHSESGDDQALCIALFTDLGNDDLLKWAHAHKDIVDRFGRFPHRNAILGRESTAEETAFLEQPGSSF